MTLYESVIPPLLTICIRPCWEDHVTKDLSRECQVWLKPQTDTRYLVIGRISPGSPSGPRLVVDMNVQTRDLLRRIDLTMDETIGRVVGEDGVQVGKTFDVLHGYPVVRPYLRCLANGGHPDSRNGEVRRNRVVGRQGHSRIRV